MAFVFADRIREIWTGSGTGSVSLGGAATGYRAVSTAMANGDVSDFLITDGTLWEVSRCTYTSSGNSLARTKVLSNSAGTNVAIAFTSGINKAVCMIGSSRQASETFFAQRGRIDGLQMTRPSATTISIGAGVCRSSDNLSTINLPAAITGKSLQSSGTWSAGSSGRGLDTGAIAASTWYHVYAIENSTTGACDVIVSLSASAPAFPTGFDKARLIGSVLTNGSTQIIDFVQRGDFFYWKAPPVDASAIVVGTAGTNLPLSVPLGLVTQPLFSAVGNDPTGSNGRLLFAVQPGLPLATGGGVGAGVTATPVAGGMPPLLTDTSSNILVGGGTATTTATITTYGFIHPRGKDA